MIFCFEKYFLKIFLKNVFDFFWKKCFEIFLNFLKMFFLEICLNFFLKNIFWKNIVWKHIFWQIVFEKYYLRTEGRRSARLPATGCARTMRSEKTEHSTVFAAQRKQNTARFIILQSQWILQQTYITLSASTALLN